MSFDSPQWSDVLGVALWMVLGFTAIAGISGGIIYLIAGLPR